ncbi:MAG: glycosyltransferase family protein [Candidatus Omnitrophota bacterium]
MKATIIVQARTGSTRLPGKVLLKVLNKSVLEHLIERLMRAKAVDRIIVATTIAQDDNKIVDLAAKMGISAYQGSEEDVLDRFYQTALQFGLKDIVRITADCPLMDPSVIDKGIECYFSSATDYASNVLERTYPDGEDVEVFSFDALRRAWKETRLRSEREHVTLYVRKHPEKFKLTNFKNEINIADKRWTLDREEDFIFVKKVYEGLYPDKQYFGMEDIMNFLKNNPGTEEINKKWVKQYE